jgi:hypothetical protein
MHPIDARFVVDSLCEAWVYPTMYPSGTEEGSTLCSVLPLAGTLLRPFLSHLDDDLALCTSCFDVLMQDCFEIIFLVINHNICAEAPHQINIGSAGCRRYARTEMLGQLNCNCSYTTGARLDEHFLPFLQIRSFDQRLPDGQADQRDGSRFFTC